LYVVPPLAASDDEPPAQIDAGVGTIETVRLGLTVTVVVAVPEHPPAKVTVTV
jgi:hypothetical protein